MIRKDDEKQNKEQADLLKRLATYQLLWALRVHERTKTPFRGNRQKCPH